LELGKVGFLLDVGFDAKRFAPLTTAFMPVVCCNQPSC
jgi:hypothetical protein